MNCKATASTGKRCKAKAMKGYDYCFTHNKAVKDKHKAAAKKGGENRKTVYDLDNINISGIDDIPGFIVKIINEVRSGKADVKIVNAQGYLAGHLLKAFDLSDIQKRLDAVEKKINERNQFNS